MTTQPALAACYHYADAGTPAECGLCRRPSVSPNGLRQQAGPVILALLLYSFL